MAIVAKFYSRVKCDGKKKLLLVTTNAVELLILKLPDKVSAKPISQVNDAKSF